MCTAGCSTITWRRDSATSRFSGWLTRRQAICRTSAFSGSEKCLAGRWAISGTNSRPNRERSRRLAERFPHRQEADPSRLLGYRTAVRAGWSGLLLDREPERVSVADVARHRATPRRAESRTSISARAWASPATSSCSIKSSSFSRWGCSPTSTRCPQQRMVRQAADARGACRRSRCFARRPHDRLHRAACRWPWPGDVGDARALVRWARPSR